MISRTAVLRAGAAASVFALALAAWQLLHVTGVLDPGSFPSMTATLSALGHQLGAGTLWTAVGQTLQGWALGLLIGSAVALVLGSILGSSRFLYLSAVPVVELLKTVPAIAILPLVIIVYGATLEMKVFLVAFGVAWPLVIQVIYGVRSVDPVVRDTARALQLRGLRRWFTIVLPSAAPFVATGLRIASATALILSVVAELVGGAPGVGLSILTAENAGPTRLPTMYAYILVTGIAGVVLTGAFTLMERRLLHWHESQRNRSSMVSS